jgi:hypothetical protein
VRSKDYGKKNSMCIVPRENKNGKKDASSPNRNWYKETSSKRRRKDFCKNTQASSTNSTPKLPACTEPVSINDE